MKEQYQRAVSQIHVPNELLLKTKRAMKEEEERLDGQNRKGKVIPFRLISLAAAAVLAVVISIPIVSGLIRTGEEAEMTKPGIQLAEPVQPQLGSIAKGDSVQDSELTVTKVSGIPQEWTETEEITVSGKLMIIAVDENTGCFMAYDAQEGVLISSEITDKEAFLKALGNEL